MATRKRIYYPEQQIVTNLFTNGQEWMLQDDWSEYVGFYHKYLSTGEVYSEGTWHPNKSKVLVQYKKKSPDYFKYTDIVNYTTVNGQKKEMYGPVKLDRYTAPIATPVKPTPSDISLGTMTRYFLVKRNEKETKNPIEIDKNQADTYPTLNYGINQYLYELIELPWKIVGPEFDVIKDGIIVTPGVTNTNQRIVMVFSRKFPILNTVLTNFKQFSIYDK